MVAESNQHYESGVLQKLLDDDLSSDDAQRVEDHLSSCTDCRAELEQIAGENSWWNETVSVLSESTLGKPVESRSAESTSIDPSIDWILPLLDNADNGKLGSIDRYTVDEVIGQGGMGVVLRGTDPELNRPVAIKILSPHLAGVGAARARFMREAQAAASIVHPSIVPIYGVITSARLPYIVMPYIRGGNLQQRIDDEGPMELRDVLRVGLQVAEGLTAAHRNGVIHRDIKPSNMLVEEGNGRVLISDFGLARALDDATLTNSGMIAGTPPYMSPEQARGDSIDARSDLFSLGSLLYALSTGRPPFRAETPLGVLRKVTETSAKPITQINERMPPWLDQLVGRFMEIDVDRRIESAESAAELLRSAHAHVVNPSLNALPKPLNQVSVRRHAWMFTAIAIVATVLIGVAALRNESESWQRDDPVPMSATESLSTQSTTSASPAMVGDEWMAGEIDTELGNIQSTIDNLSTEMNFPLPN